MEFCFEMVIGSWCLSFVQQFTHKFIEGINCFIVIKYLFAGQCIIPVCGIFLDFFLYLYLVSWYEPPHDKTNKMSVRPAKTQISLGIRPVWSETSLSAWWKLGSIATHRAHSEDFGQTGRIPSWSESLLGAQSFFLVLSWGGSYHENVLDNQNE